MFIIVGMVPKHYKHYERYEHYKHYNYTKTQLPIL